MSEIMTANTILAPGPAWFNPYFLLLGEQKQKELCNWYLFEDGKVIASFKWPDDEHRDNDQRVPMTLEEPTIRKRSVDLSSRTPFYVPCDCEYKLEQKQGHLYVPTSLLPIRQDHESVTEHETFRERHRRYRFVDYPTMIFFVSERIEDGAKQKMNKKIEALLASENYKELKLRLDDIEQLPTQIERLTILQQQIAAIRVGTLLAEPVQEA